MGFVNSSAEIRTLNELEQTLDDNRILVDEKVRWTIETLFANPTLANNYYVPESITIEVRETGAE